MPVPQSFRNAAYPEETDEIFGVLLVLENSALEEPIRLTDMYGPENPTYDAEGITVGGEFYFTAPIEVYPPGQSDEEPEGKLIVPNVDQRIGQGLDQITDALIATVTIVLQSDPTVVMGGPHQLLQVRNVRGDALSIEGDLTRPFLVQERWPKEWIHPGKFRAAFRV